jgi:hypothetical protein
MTRHRGDVALKRCSERLAADIASGAWERRFGHLRRRVPYDAEYRIAIAE